MLRPVWSISNKLNTLATLFITALFLYEYFVGKIRE